MEESAYAKAGVNIDLGNEASKILYNASRETWKNRGGRLGEVIVPYDDFSGVRGIDISGLPQGTILGMGLDGIGTKIEIGERMKEHRNMAYNLIAMISDDAVVKGAEPLVIGTILDVRSLGNQDRNYLDKIRELAIGYVNAARTADVAILNGEVAELGSRVNGFGNFNYNWGGTAIWVVKKERILTGKKIEVGDSIVGLEEPGFRSNGMSLVRKIMQENHGDNWHDVKWRESGLTLGQKVLTPSTIYTRAAVEMFGGYNKQQEANVHGIAHITGGGIPEKLGRILKPSGLGAEIDPMEPSEFMLYTQAIGNVPDRQAYETWNMGQGMVIITPNPVEVEWVAGRYNIRSAVIGEVTEDPTIRIHNKGVFRKENPGFLTFEN